MPDTYWSNRIAARLNRRRFIAGAATSGAAALFLAACGGGSDEKPLGNTSGIFSEPTDTTFMAKPGGAVRDFQTSDIPHFDVASTNFGSVTTVGTYTLSKLVKYVARNTRRRAMGMSRAIWPRVSRFLLIS